MRIKHTFNLSAILSDLRADQSRDDIIYHPSIDRSLDVKFGAKNKKVYIIYETRI